MSAGRNLCPHTSASGFSMLEVLVSMIVLAIGLLGLSGLQARVSVAEVESYQRTQALLLAQNMADRIAANASAVRADIAAHSTKDPSGAVVYSGGAVLYTTVLNTTDVGGAEQTCSGSGAAFDLCEWGNLVAGASEKSAASQSIGTLSSGRGCVRKPNSTGDPYLFLVSVAWQGRIATKAPGDGVDCGKDAKDADNKSIYTSDSKRRVVTVPVRIAKLS